MVTGGAERGRVAAVALVAAAGVATNVAAARLTSVAAPFTDFGVLVLTAAVGSTFAICAVVAISLRAAAPAIAMLAGSFIWTFGSFYPSIQLVSAWWVPLFALSGSTGIVAVLLIVSFPTGRVSGRLAWAVLALALALAATRVLIRTVAISGNWCLCVPNPVQALPDDVGNGWHRIDLGISAVLAVGGLAVLLVRWTRGSRPWRATNLLITATAAALAVETVVENVQLLLPGPDQGPGPAYLDGALLATVPIVYVCGLVAVRQARGRVADVVLAAKAGLTDETWDALISQALDDRSAHVVWRSEGGFRDRNGAIVEAPEGYPVGDPVVGVIRHDPAVADPSPLLASLAASIAIVHDNARLNSELGRSLQETRRSRARLVTASDDARRRIERDLHDGAQQVLLSAAVHVEVAAGLARDIQDERLTAALRLATDQLRTAREELRELARGIGPSALEHSGLRAALNELALRAPIPTSIAIDGAPEVSDSAARATYFVIAEALTNSARHGGANRVTIDVHLGDRVTVVVTDDGRGGAEIVPGGGLQGLSDRVEAIGGALTVADAPDGGARLEVVVPGHPEQAGL